LPNQRPTPDPTPQSANETNGSPVAIKQRKTPTNHAGMQRAIPLRNLIAAGLPEPSRYLRH
jgi:hypothetical protein